MSAVAGRWNFTGRPNAGESCRRALAAQRMYGPHGDTLWDDGDIALGCARYDLLEEDRYDRQPLTGRGGQVMLVADLRLDNRDELARALGVGAAEVGVMADAALLLQAWERWDIALFDHLVGDYAFALWDKGRRQLILARDHLGGRPLHYHRDGHFVAFASMPKGLHALAEIPLAPDGIRNTEFLALLPESGPRSFFEGISRVEAGQAVVITADGISIVKHWQPKRHSLKLSSFDDYTEAAREHLDRAVASRLRGAGQRVGSHLSAGLDSSGIAATAARLMANRGGQVVAFTYAPRSGYDGEVPAGRLADEADLAAATAGLYPNIDHVLLRSDGRSQLDDQDRDYHLFDRPLLNAEVQHRFNMTSADAQRRGLSVMLIGTMGNATLSYSGLTLLPELAARFRLIALLRATRALIRDGKMSWKGVLAQTFGSWMPETMWRALNRHFTGFAPDLADYSALNGGLVDELNLRATARVRQLDFSYRPRREAFEEQLWILRRVDFGNNQKGVQAGWGVDLRDPMTDRRLVEFCLSLPTDVYLRNGESRALARRALADRLPPRVIEERRRGLQAIDWHEDLTAAREELRSEIKRLMHVPAASRALDVPRMLALVEDWPSDGWNTAAIESRYRFALCRGVTIGHFLRKASGSNA
jgi:asparagine synthase (glutamine-hydrolysing)